MKVTDAASAYKVLAEQYTSLFTSPKVEEEMVKQVGNIQPVLINPDFCRALDVSFESSMATWQLGSHMTVLINYLYDHCQGDPVLKAVCNHLHGAIRESHQTSAQAASVAIAAQGHMILDASLFRDCTPLRATLLSTPFVGSSLFGGQFQSSLEEATSSQEKLTQVRLLASSGSRAAQGTSGSRVPPQSQKRRAAPPPPPPAAQLVPSGDGGSAAKRRWSKTGETTDGLVGPLLSLRLSRAPGGRGSPTRGLPLGAVDGSTPSPPLIPPTLGGGGGVDLSGHSWSGLGYTAWNCTERSLPCGQQAVVFPPSLATNNLGHVCPGGY